MSELTTLLAKKQEMLARLKDLEAVGEGLENEENRQQVQKLNAAQTTLMAQKKAAEDRLAAVKNELQAVTDEVNRLSGDSRDQILEAIKNQRWFFIKNKPKVLLDRNTGYLWANLNYFPYCKDEQRDYYKDEVLQVIQSFDGDGYLDWKLPDVDEFKEMIGDKTFPFKRGNNHQILEKYNWLYMSGNIVRRVDLDNFNTSDNSGWMFPYTRALVTDSNYKDDVAADNKVYTEKERLQFTLDLFLQNELQPIFADDSITELYHQLYFEKPKLMADLQALNEQIDALQENIPLSGTFDYRDLLGDYDIKAIDASLIQYYTAVQRWIGTLLEKLDEYEGLKDDVIRDFNVISLTLSKKYEADPNLTADENSLLERRQRFFRQRFSLDMNQVKEKLLSVKEQADALEERLDDLDASDQSLTDWASLNAECRPSFAFIAENTAKIIKKALLKIEYFETHKELVQEAIALWQAWSDDYRVFKSTRRQELQQLCEEDDIEEEVWSAWYKDWQRLRRKIEEGMEPLVAWSLKELVMDGDKELVQGKLLDQLAAYKQQLDDFFLKERKGIYQKYAFQPGGDLQEKFAAESDLYKRTLAFQEAVSKILFSCPKNEDRIVIFKWAYPLWNLQIDAVLQFVADRSLDQISEKVLHEFADLKKRNYAAFLNDAAAYSKAQKEREKQYDSLMFKMRKELASKS